MKFYNLKNRVFFSCAVAAALAFTGCSGKATKVNPANTTNDSVIENIIDNNDNEVIIDDNTSNTDSDNSSNEDTNTDSNESSSTETTETEEVVTEDDKIFTTPILDDSFDTTEYQNSKLAQIGAITAYKAGYTGQGVKIAFLDSGLNDTHQEFENRNIESISFNSYKYDVDSDSMIFVENGLVADQLEKVLITDTITTTVEDGLVELEILGAGENAAGYARIQNGEVTEILLSENGTGYDDNTRILLDGVELENLEIVQGGKDSYGHGTGVASISAANRDMSNEFDIENDNGGTMGVAYNSDILSIKVFKNVTSGTPFIAPDALNNSIAYATQADAQVINMSIGSVTNGYSANIINDTMRDALDNNASFVIAAGNSGLDCLYNAQGTLAGKCSFPSATPWLNDGANADLLTRAGGWVVVGAVDDNNERLWFSNKAGVTKNNYIVANGQSAFADEDSNNGYSSGYGTSYAAPYVAGAMALMYERFPNLDGNQIAQIFFNTATDLGETGIDDVYGNGLINLEAAFQPIGTLSIPESKNLGTGSQISLESTSMISTKAFGNSLLNLASLDNTIGFDSYQRDFKLSLSNAISSTSSTTDDVEDSFDFESLKVFSKKNFLLGLNENEEIALGYQVNDNFRFLVSQEKDLYGMESSGAFTLGSAKTSYLQAALKTELNSDFTLFSTLEYGRGTAKSKSGSMISDVSSVNSIGGKVALEYDNKFGVSVKVPRRIVSGSMDFNIPTSRSGDTVNFEKVSASLSPDATEQTFEVYGKYSSKNLSLSGSVGRTENKNHIAGQTDNSVSVNLKYTF